jgi:hypothetical protein
VLPGEIRRGWGEGRKRSDAILQCERGGGGRAGASAGKGKRERERERERERL